MGHAAAQRPAVLVLDGDAIRGGGGGAVGRRTALKGGGAAGADHGCLCGRTRGADGNRDRLIQPIGAEVGGNAVQLACSQGHVADSGGGGGLFRWAGFIIVGREAERVGGTIRPRDELRRVVAANAPASIRAGVKGGVDEIIRRTV